MDFTDEEFLFLNQHNISVNDIYDARNCKSQKERKEKAKQNHKLFYIGGKCTRNSNHRIRTRNHKCIHCRPIEIAFQKRSAEIAYVYIAGSLAKQLIKVGYSGDVYAREESLNVFKYGKADDWKILKWVKVKSAGEKEVHIQKQLSHYLFPSEYLKEGRWQPTRELFSCSFTDTINALNHIIKDDDRLDEKAIDLKFFKPYCDFPNIKNQ